MKLYDHIKWVPDSRTWCILMLWIKMATRYGGKP